MVGMCARGLASSKDIFSVVFQIWLMPNSKKVHFERQEKLAFLQHLEVTCSVFHSLSLLGELSSDESSPVRIPDMCWSEVKPCPACVVVFIFKDLESVWPFVRLALACCDSL